MGRILFTEMLVYSQLIKPQNSPTIAVDLNPLPVMSILAALICLVGVCLFFSQFYRGIGLCIKLLQVIFLIKTEDTEFLEEYRVNYSVLATVTFAIAFMVVLTDYLHTDARYARNPICQFCEGPIPIVVVRSQRNGVN